MSRGWRRWTASEIAELNAAALSRWHAIHDGSFLFAPAEHHAVPGRLKTIGSRVLLRMPGQPVTGLLATVACYYNFPFDHAPLLQNTWSRERFRALWDMYYGRARKDWLAERSPQVHAIGLSHITRNVLLMGFPLGAP